jgi:diaminopimelate epimerase
MKIPFMKYQGLGNDFIIFQAKEIEEIKRPDLAIAVCDRHFGIGADGMVILSEGQDLKMDFYNNDGTIAPMCGNASRCIAKYAVEQNLVEGDIFTLETLGGPVGLSILEDGRVQVDLGEPDYSVEQVPVKYDKPEMIQESIKAGGDTLLWTGVFMLTTHAVSFVEKQTDEMIRRVGSEIENMTDLFPIKTNANFVKKLDDHTLRLMTWERGAGRTLACGTGACASVAVSDRLGLTEGLVRVIMDGGELEVYVEENRVYMIGTGDKVAEGIYYYKE